MNRASFVFLFIAAVFFTGCAQPSVMLDTQSSAVLNKHATDLGKIRRIAVIPIDDEAPGDGKVYDRRNYVAGDIVELSFISLGYTVIDRSNLESILKEQSLSNTGLIDPADALKIGQQFGVDALAFVNTSEDLQTTRVRLVDTENGRIVLTFEQNSAKVNDCLRGWDIYRHIKKELKRAGFQIDESRARSYYLGFGFHCAACVNDPALIKSIEKVAISPDAKTSMGLFPLLEKGLDVMERSELGKILKQNGLAASGILSGEDIKKLGMISGVKGIVFTRITDQIYKGNINAVIGTLKLVDARTGQVVWSVCAGLDRNAGTPDNAKPEEYVAVANKRFGTYLDKIMK